MLNQFKRKIWSQKTCVLNAIKGHHLSTKAKESGFGFKESVHILDNNYAVDDWTNITPKVVSLIGRNLYLKKGNPLYLLSEAIRHYFKDYDFFVFADPVVDLKSNFDSLLIPKDHVSRQKSDTYYVNKDYVLRSHTSAHQNHCLHKKSTAFVCIADVYRRDEIDRRHHSVFHQCEAFRLYHNNSPQLISRGINHVFESHKLVRTDSKQENHCQEVVDIIESEMKTTIEAFVRNLLWEDIPMRWVSAYFPFTHPSWELEIYHNNDWIEILGSGIVEHKLLQNAGINDNIGWALGIGLERLAMIRYQIPDIRLFWTNDSGFLSQFESACHSDKIVYKPISSHPQLIFDISFWLPQQVFWCCNDFYDLVRNIGGDLIEQVKVIDEYTTKEGKKSHTYRIVYRSHERMLSKDEVNVVHKQIERYVTDEWKVAMR
ncbi:unnamed protein product [Oppiella nova]|uniref:phenylalanine--tRNA ligase n=1 Tax=Oppiella nova TaxID=334625 RepID=A0A7R9M2H3_9ACAR|nr:unnamed protein product [Oppiella nova]CAG2169496.1 unnamed protein product [Oppiella nova]